MLETILGFLSDYAIPLGALAAILAIIETVFAPFRKAFRKVETVELGRESREALSAPKAKDGPALTVTEFIRIRRELKSELVTELAQASQGEKQQLRARIAELESQIADPEPALAEAKKRITELEALLERSGNEIGGDRLTEARNALEQGDYSIADDLFAEIEARREMEVQEAARAAYGRGEIAEAEVRWADAAAHYARAARLHPEFDSLYNAVDFSQLAGEYQRAERMAEDLVALARQNADDVALSRALDRQATILWRLERNSEAEPIYREALGIDRSTIGEEHPNYATRLNNLALVVAAQDRNEEAEELYREALKIIRATIGAGHPAYATHLNNLALVVQAQGRHAEAEGLYREVLEIDRATIGEGHPGYATDLNNLAYAVQAQGCHAEAEGLYREALEIDRATIGTGHPDYATHLNNLALVVAAQGRHAEAEGLYREALKIDLATIGEGHPGYATDLNNLAGAVQAQGRHAEAEGLYCEALEIAERTLGPDHPKTITCRENLDHLLESQTPPPANPD
ncbi:tetratricopeptide repeat protein [Roseovarius sp. ZX-A-9]|uniref:tetratricopeptide repeat protein n=1 Tax=Roseovarius sp. ZX-A-9 TaxID=3014783 RepID=UPI0023300537|nr:tetratricopeptide repeat protein [Roseovarius sp. ZX-A-9]